MHGVTVDIFIPANTLYFFANFVLGMTVCVKLAGAAPTGRVSHNFRAATEVPRFASRAATPHMARFALQVRAVVETGTDMLVAGFMPRFAEASVLGRRIPFVGFEDFSRVTLEPNFFTAGVGKWDELVPHATTLGLAKRVQRPFFYFGDGSGATPEREAVRRARGAAYAGVRDIGERITRAALGKGVGRDLPGARRALLDMLPVELAVRTAEIISYREDGGGGGGGGAQRAVSALEFSVWYSFAQSVDRRHVEDRLIAELALQLFPLPVAGQTANEALDRVGRVGGAMVGPLAAAVTAAGLSATRIGSACRVASGHVARAAAARAATAARDAEGREGTHGAFARRKPAPN